MSVSVVCVSFFAAGTLHRQASPHQCTREGEHARTLFCTSRLYTLVSQQQDAGSIVLFSVAVSLSCFTFSADHFVITAVGISALLMPLSFASAPLPWRFCFRYGCSCFLIRASFPLALCPSVCQSVRLCVWRTVPITIGRAAVPSLLLTFFFNFVSLLRASGLLPCFRSSTPILSPYDPFESPAVSIHTAALFDMSAPKTSTPFRFPFP